MNPIFTTPAIEQVEAMYNKGTPEIVVDQGLYYPAATNHGYYCTGFESPAEWEDHHRIFGVDGPEIQYAGAQSERLPYVYYTPSFGYAQSPYNPYNPYIPGAIIGVDGPYAGAQHYYTIPPYQDPASSAGYIPIIVQPDIVPNGSAEPLLDTGNGRSFRNSIASSPVAFPRNSPKPASNQSNSLTTISEKPRANVGLGKQSMTHGSVSSGGFPSQASSQVLKNKNASGSFPSVDNISNGKILHSSNQLKAAFSVNDGLSDFHSSAEAHTSVDKLQPKIHVGGSLNVVSRSPVVLGEQNQGPKTGKSKNQLAVKAYTTNMGDSNVQGNAIVHADQYNIDDFSADYFNAKFFVIKSYSEDDVHKSIKYNVWSSTPNGNKKLQCAYEDAQKIAAGKPRGCPIFLFFSVNASGHFCGVAEMDGPVDFHKDMDFWHQNKWSGSFLVKWHIIKDVPNSSFRHIILENNENKPVTNSRDTQEIMCGQGLEMLKIFKNYNSKTSLLDDFIFYENRERIMQEEKARIVFRRYETPFVTSALDPTHKLTGVSKLPPKTDEQIMELNNNGFKKTEVSADELHASGSNVTNFNNRGGNLEESTDKAEDGVVSALNIGSLDINPTQAASKALTEATLSDARAEPVDIVTVGSMSVKVDGFTANPGILTVGTIPLDPRALQRDKEGAVVKTGSK